MDIAEHQQPESQFQQVVEMAPNAMVMIDKDGTIEMVNAQAEKIFGYARTELLGQTVDLLLPVRFRAQHPHHRDTFFANPIPRAMGSGRDLFGLRKDGSEFPVEIGLNPITTSSGVKVLSAIIDISERIEARHRIEAQLNELLRINVELNNFSYVASHDLKSPLRGIDQLATWIEDDLADTLNPETREHLRLMRSRIKRMERLLDDLLAYSRVGRTDDEIATVNTAALINDIVDLIATNKRIDLQLGPDLPVFQTRKVPLELVLRNLISNAIKHHDKAEGCIRISARIHSGWIQFCVSDNGPGIAPRHHERVFGMFQTLKPRDEIEGSGIGLALVKKAVESLGGKVWLESDGQSGCTFFFTWPMPGHLCSIRQEECIMTAASNDYRVAGRYCDGLTDNVDLPDHY